MTIICLSNCVYVKIRKIEVRSFVRSLPRGHVLHPLPATVLRLARLFDHTPTNE